MSLHHAASGEVINLSPLGPQLAETASQALFKTSQLEAMRLILPAGKEIQEHKVTGDFTLHCLEGRVEIRLEDRTEELQPGQMLYVAAEEPYSIRSLDDASLLMTLARCRETEQVERSE